jgi:hypothetical protein
MHFPYIYTLLVHLIVSDQTVFSSELPNGLSICDNEMDGPILKLLATN